MKKTNIYKMITLILLMIILYSIISFASDNGENTKQNTVKTSSQEEESYGHTIPYIPDFRAF